MTKKAEKDKKKGKRAKVRLTKETLKDLDAGKRAEDVKAGSYWCAKSANTNC